jgi:hypothetical protein
MNILQYAEYSLGVIMNILRIGRVHCLELSGTFPVWTFAGLNFELAIRGREALCDESLVFTCHGEMDMSNESYLIIYF